MPVIGLNFKSIDANVEERKVSGEVAVNSTPHIRNIAKKDIDVPGMKDILSIEFEFVTKYEPRIGEINIKGEVLYQTDEAKKILTMWKNKNVETKMAVDVLNAIFRKCITKAIQLTDELSLPPPLTFPIVKTETQSKAEKEDTGKKAADS